MTTAAQHGTSTQRTRISAIVLTRNEQELLGRCLSSIRHLVDEIVVVDSGSTDDTCTIASQFGARVITQPWLGWVAQRGVGIDAATHDWVLVIEADEIVTPSLAKSIDERRCSPMDVNDGYTIDRRDDFLGVLLPSMRRRKKRLSFVRLFNRTRSAYDPSLIVHEEVRVPGRLIALDGILIHWRGMSIVQQVGRYAEYAPLEASVLESRGERVGALSLLWRPFLRFGWCYVMRGGFRLGARGFVHALMVSTSEFLRFAETWERQHGGAVADLTPKVAEQYMQTDAIALRSALPESPSRSASALPEPAGLLGSFTAAGGKQDGMN